RYRKGDVAFSAGQSRMPAVIRTKILVTIGPACSSVDTLHRMFEAGADACRINFSHGSLDDHLQVLRNIHEAAARGGQPVAVVGDLGGPKIRLGAIAEVDQTGGMPIEVGEDLVIQRAPMIGQKRRVSSTYAGIVDDVRVGDRLFVEDGLLRFVCTEK